MDHSLWTGEQPQPNLRPKEQVPPLFPGLCCRGRWGLCSFWKHLFSLVLCQISFWLPQGLSCSPASPSLSLLVLDLGASAEEPCWLRSWFLAWVPLQRNSTGFLTFLSRSGPPGLLPGLRSVLCWSSSGVCCGIACALLMAGPRWWLIPIPKLLNASGLNGPLHLLLAKELTDGSRESCP